jgi:hypothetical protein
MTFQKPMITNATFQNKCSFGSVKSGVIIGINMNIEKLNLRVKLEWYI